MEDIERLEQLSGEDYDCTCDMEAPWGHCVGCIAGHALNEIAETARVAIKEIDGKIKRKNNES